MKYCLASLFLFAGLLLHSSGKDFRVYAPASKSNTLWIILVKSNESGDAVQMEIEQKVDLGFAGRVITCLLYTSPSPRDLSTSRMPSSA